MPAGRMAESDRAHWRKTWNLIERAVFQTEDLVVAERIQSSLGSGLQREFRIGATELPIRWFHESLEETCGC